MCIRDRLVPIALGFVVNHFFHEFTQQAVRVLPLVSTTAIVPVSYTHLS